MNERSVLLFEAIKDCGKNIAELADALSMDRSTFYRKAKSPSKTFTVEQAIKLQQLTGMSKPRFEAIFF